MVLQQKSTKRDTKQSQLVVLLVLVAVVVVFVLVVVVCLAVYCLLFDVAVCRPLEPPHISQKTKAKGVNRGRGRGWA